MPLLDSPVCEKNRLFACGEGNALSRRQTCLHDNLTDEGKPSSPANDDLNPSRKHDVDRMLDALQEASVIGPLSRQRGAGHPGHTNRFCARKRPDRAFSCAPGSSLDAFACHRAWP